MKSEYNNKLVVGPSHVVNTILCPVIRIPWDEGTPCTNIESVADRLHKHVRWESKRNQL